MRRAAKKMRKADRLKLIFKMLGMNPTVSRLAMMRMLEKNTKIRIRPSGYGAGKVWEQMLRVMDVVGSGKSVRIFWADRTYSDPRTVRGVARVYKKRTGRKPPPRKPFRINISCYDEIAKFDVKESPEVTKLLKKMGTSKTMTTKRGDTLTIMRGRND